ncbi:tRNA modification GTPase MnmE [Stieleria neptunia]|uniref:tRNA modification GTPase MnmE n=1 Tax=Stieleria neptunia TaxID=2527979 RepID=A0A518HHX7_9BACT|nr:tRNA modification GTPase [Stieleria neptunia]QDV40437.1 tRNA modification GTPase MnmE [Stieleria neptunia]
MGFTGAIETEDTIVAIGSSTTPAPRGAVRFSGVQAMEIARQLGIEPTSDRSAHCVDGTIALDHPLGEIPVRALVWPTARSYTGQPSLEIHTFGSMPILGAIVWRAIELGARAARPGEFTLRAFLAGRLDLTQAEAVLGVIEAEGRGSLDHALRQLAGNLSRPMEFMRSQLLDLLADVEAGLDFVDEDIQFISDDDLVARLDSIRSTLATTREQLTQRTRDKSQWIIALRGLPNAGKSRLLNVLAGHDAAIVADQAGTTRDVVSVPMQWDDHNVVLVDTAGIETADGDSSLEQISHQAQLQAHRAGRDADIRLWCVDHTSSDWQATCRAMRQLADEKRRPAIDLWVATKCDCSGEQDLPDPWIRTSALTGAGIESLRQQITAAIESLDTSEGVSILGTAARCTGSLRAAETAIASAIGYVGGGDGHEYVSSELRLAASALGEVTGAVYTDDILDRVFSRFCIGK